MVVSMDRWNGKVAIVTGASGGIGAAIAEQLVEAGLQVAGFGRRVERVEEQAKTLQDKKGKLHGVKVDITKEEEILEGFKWVTKKLGPVSILVNSAGVSLRTSLTDGDTETWRQILDTNVLSLCIATREAVKIMKANKIDGHIIHLNGITGHSVPNIPNLNVIPASKHAVTALTETLRQEFNQLGLKIKITSISPGTVDTEMIKNSLRKFVGDPAALESFKKIVMLKAEDVADAVSYILGTPPHVQIHELIVKPVGELI